MMTRKRWLCRAECVQPFDDTKALACAGLNVYSRTITEPKSQGASQAQLYATGLDEEDMSKPQVRSLCCVFLIKCLRCKTT